MPTERHAVAQSPIELLDPSASPKTQSLPRAHLRIKRREHTLHVVNDGYTIQVDVKHGDRLTIGDRKYTLQQYHFHAPAEHLIGGKQYPMEMHLVFQDASEELAVVGVFIKEGRHHPAFEAIWSQMQGEKGSKVRIKDVGLRVDDLLPREKKSWRYQGSRTTPPFDKSVSWILPKHPIELSSGQIAQYTRLFHGNNRPAQPLEGRSIVSDRLDVEIED